MRDTFQQTAGEMRMFRALTAILFNMENGHYTEKVLSKTDFLEEFRSATRAELNAAEKLIRPNPRETIIRKDKERKSVLDALVKTLEMNENLSEGDLREWIESIKT